jgi:hypothetical protein
MMTWREIYERTFERGPESFSRSERETIREAIEAAWSAGAAAARAPLPSPGLAEIETLALAFKGVVWDTAKEAPGAVDRLDAAEAALLDAVRGVVEERERYKRTWADMLNRADAAERERDDHRRAEASAWQQRSEMAAERDAAEAALAGVRWAARNLLERLAAGATEGWGIWADNLRAALASPYLDIDRSVVRVRIEGQPASQDREGGE